MKTYLHASLAMLTLFAIWYGFDRLEDARFPAYEGWISTAGFFIGALAAIGVVQIGRKRDWR